MNTPRTDAETLAVACDDSPDIYHPDGAYVPANFARQLETEVQELRTALSSVYAWALEVDDEKIDGEGIRKEYSADLGAARAALAKVPK